MKRTLGVLLAVACSACLNFDTAFESCHLPGGRCADDDAGTGGSAGGGTGGGADGGGTGGGAVGGGGGTGGGAVGGGVGGGTGGGGGTGEDAGIDAGFDAGCGTCVFFTGQCLAAGNRNDACGTGGGACVDCASNNQTCDPVTLSCASWQFYDTEYTHDQLWGAWAVAPGEVWFAGFNSSAVHVQGGALTDYYWSGTNANALYVESDGGRAFAVGSRAGQGLARTFNLPWDGGDDPGVMVSLAIDALFTVFPVGNDVYVAGKPSSSGSPIVFVRDAGGWTPATPVGMTGWGQDGFGVGPGEYYLVTSQPNALGHKSPTAYSSTPLSGVPFSIWGTPSGTLWVAGNNYFARVQRDGGESLIDAGANSRWWSVWAWDDSTVFLAGRDSLGNGCVGRFDGTSVRRTCLSPKELVSIHGIGPLDVWVGDADGGIWHYAP